MRILHVSNFFLCGIFISILFVCPHSGSTDRFEFSSKNVGDIAGICVGHIPKDGKKSKTEAFWHVLEVIITEKELKNK